MTTAPPSTNTSVRDNPAYQAYLLLRVGFVVALILFGLDKVTNLLTDWTAYLAPAIDRLVPGSATGAMLAVGVVEIAAGLVVAVRPKVGGSGRRLAGRDHHQPAAARRPLRRGPARLRAAAGRPGPGPARHRLRPHPAPTSED